MPIQHAVLALLANGPSHGYELKSAFEASVGPQWGPLNIGHLYQVLDRLSRDGLVTSTRVAQPVKPDRVVYEITGAGRSELAEWMGLPSPRTAGFRDDFFLKVMAAAHTRDPAVVQAVITTQRAFLLRELHNLEQLRQEHCGELGSRSGELGGDLVVGLLLAAAARHVSADLAFLDDTEETLLAGGGAGLASLPTPAPEQDRSASSNPRRVPPPNRAAA
jgi:DNA-binding PadR family transcriptional regulator